MMRGFSTVLLLLLSNTFMTIAWYGHLRFKEVAWLKDKGLLVTILISWGIAFFEYLLMVPANKLGSSINGGPFNMWQLKLVQEAISISVFVIFTLIFFKTEELRVNHLLGFLFLFIAAYFFFKK